MSLLLTVKTLFKNNTVSSLFSVELVKTKEYSIYIFTNKIDGKMYIGRTSDIKRRTKEHCCKNLKTRSHFNEAILKYGIDNFELNILERCCDIKTADELEIKYIKEFREKYGNDMLYNICKGGPGGQTHDVSGKNNPQYNRKWTDEEKENVRNKLKGRKKPEGFGAKLSKALTGKPKSKEHVAKRSHPIYLKNIYTSEIRRFDSKTEAERQVSFDFHHMKKYPNYHTKTGWEFYKEEKDVETTSADFTTASSTGDRENG